MGNVTNTQIRQSALAYFIPRSVIEAVGSDLRRFTAFLGTSSVYGLKYRVSRNEI